MKNFLKENWFKLAIIIILLWITYSFTIFVNHQVKTEGFEVKNYTK